MIADLKPYPAMKESDVPWLGGNPCSAKTRHEVNLTRNFHKAQPVLVLEESRTVIRAPDRETDSSLGQMTGGGAA